MSDGTVHSGNRVCHGCHDPPEDDVELKTFEMEHGGTETLCPDCVRQSHSTIKQEITEVESA